MQELIVHLQLKRRLAERQSKKQAEVQSLLSLGERQKTNLLAAKQVQFTSSQGLQLTSWAYSSHHGPTAHIMGLQLTVLHHYSLIAVVINCNILIMQFLAIIIHTHRYQSTLMYWFVSLRSNQYMDFTIKYMYI